MFQDARIDVGERAIARRQAFSTTTRSISETRSSHSHTTDAPSTSSTALGAFEAVHTLTGTESPPSWFCTVALPSGGIIRFNDSFALELDDNLSYQAPCANQTVFAGLKTTHGNSTVLTFGTAFYASISPQVYALATATVLSYLLVIILFITPRTFYVGGPGGSAAYGGGGASTLLNRGMTFIGTGGTGSGVIGVGRRPLLQKIAALTVMVSLTIATADTFKVAEKQYSAGYMDSHALVNKVVGSTEVRVTRVVSDAFLWLAQVQTLIRLFPRHKEKVTIKWLGFGLVVCDTIFSILENFVSESHLTRPESFTDAIPALSYLFELAISLIYASCVIYYSLSKRRFAFWSSKMKSMCIMALLSITAVLIPVVFFIVDVAQPDIATWGEYIRWVGAAAASVVVWEWVERIEALERDEKKDGILGREIFDSDEMLDMAPFGGRGSDNNGSLGDNHNSNNPEAKRPIWKDIRDLNLRSRMPQVDWRKSARHFKRKPAISESEKLDDSTNVGIARPPNVATPISRTDTTSASTIYAVRYHNHLSPTPAVIEESGEVNEVDGQNPHEQSDESTLTNNTTREDHPSSKRTSHAESDKAISSGRQIWQGVSNPFKRKRMEPPAEVAAQIYESNSRRSPAIRSLHIKDKFNAFSLARKSKTGGDHEQKPRTPLQVTIIPAQRRGSRMKQSVNPTTEANTQPIESVPHDIDVSRTVEEHPPDANLPVTVIPAPKRGGRTWSPDDLHDPSAQNSPPSRTQTPVANGSHTQIQFVFGENRNTQDSSPSQSHASRTNLSTSQKILRDTSNSPGSHVRFKPSGRDRGTTMTSISDRLSTSPTASPPTSVPTPVSGRQSVIGGNTNSSQSQPQPQPQPQPRPRDGINLSQIRPVPSQRMNSNESQKDRLDSIHGSSSNGKDKSTSSESDLHENG